MENASIVGLDTSKSIFHFCLMNHQHRVIGRRKVHRADMGRFIDTLPKTSTVYLEACQGSHYWCREIESRGVRARQIPAQYVKPFVKTNKHDYADAEGIGDAGSRENMRFVSTKSMEQLEGQSIMRTRQRLVGERTACSNQMRGILAEFGVVLPKGISYLKNYCSEYLGKKAEIPALTKRLLAAQYEELKEIEMRIKSTEKLLGEWAARSETCRRLQSIPGIGKLGAISLLVLHGNPHEFRSSKAFSASLGLVPRQHSTGGKSVLLGISKRGDTFTRTILIHGARTVVRHATSIKGKQVKNDPYSLWVRKLHAQYGTNHTAVALANKNARIAWKIITTPEILYDAQSACRERLDIQ